MIGERLGSGSVVVVGKPCFHRDEPEGERVLCVATCLVLRPMGSFHWGELSLGSFQWGAFIGGRV